MLGRNAYEIFPTLRELFSTVGPYLIQHATISREQVYVKHKNGRTVHVGYSATLLRDENDIITGTVVSCSDVTQRYRSAEILRSLEAAGKVVLSMRSGEDIYQATTQSLQGLGLRFLVMLVDDENDTINSRYVLSDNAIKDELNMPLLIQLRERLKFEKGSKYDTQIFSRLLNGENAVFVANILEQLPPWLSLETQELMRRAFERPEQRCAIATPLRRDGEIIGQLLVSGALSEADTPAITAFANHLSLALANAELWQSLEERVTQRTMLLRTQQEQLQTVLNNITDAVMLTDAEEKIEFVNPAWERLNGYTLDEVRGKTPKLLASPSTPYTQLAELRRSIKQKLSWAGELQNMRKDRSEYDAHMYIAPVLDNNGDIRHFVGVSRDITNEKSIARAKEKYVQDMSHELRTPLTNIKFYLSLLEKRMPDIDSKYMAILKRETDRLHNLMENLLLLLRLDQGYVNLRVAEQDIRSIINEVLSDFAGKLNDGPVEFHCDLPDEPLLARADHLLLNQALTNLLTNAIGFANSRVSIFTRRKRVDAAEWIGIAIEDDGPGISVEEQTQIYGRFFRGTSSQAQHTSGAGIGLSICQEIAAICDGEIECSSQLGKGTTFTFWIPGAPRTVYTSP